jgi:hypothetical protein
MDVFEASVAQKTESKSESPFDLDTADHFLTDAYRPTSPIHCHFDTIPTNFSRDKDLRTRLMGHVDQHTVIQFVTHRARFIRVDVVRYVGLERLVNTADVDSQQYGWCGNTEA